MAHTHPLLALLPLTFQPAAYDAYEFAYPYLRPEESQRPRGYPNQMTMEPQQHYGSSRLVRTRQEGANGGAPPSTRPYQYDERLPSYTQHHTNHGQPESHYSSRRAYRAPSNISKVSKSSVVSRGTQCSIVTTQTAVGPRSKTRGASRHHHHQQQEMATLVGRNAPPPDTHNTYTGQDSGSGGGLFGGMFSGLGSLLGEGRASGGEEGCGGMRTHGPSLLLTGISSTRLSVCLCQRCERRHKSSH